ncbi:MAG TPA: TPM domain-containing protein [Thermoanaerobaculia bacterium]
MKLRAAVLALCCAVLAAGVLAQDTIAVPKKPAKYVTDRPNVIGPKTQAALEEKLKKFGDETGNQVVVWVGSTLPADVTIEEYANASFNLWGIGQKGKNNGVLLMLFVKSRKMRIETGDGVRDRLTDAKAAQILAAMKPALRTNEYNKAFTEATDSIVAALTPPPPLPDPKKAEIAAELEALKNPPPPKADTSFTDVLSVAPACLIMLSVIGGGVVIFVLIVKAIFKFLGAVAGSIGSGGGGGYSGGGGSSNNVTVTHNHYRRGWGWGSGGWGWGSRRNNTVVNNVIHRDSGGSSSSAKDDDSGSSRGGGGGFSGGGSSSGGGASDSW